MAPRQKLDHTLIRNSVSTMSFSNKNRCNNNPGEHKTEKERVQANDEDINKAYHVKGTIKNVQTNKGKTQS